MADYFGDAGRGAEITAGLFALAASAIGLFVGVAGFIAYAHGSHEAWADPLWCSVGVASGLWLGFHGTRMILGSPSGAALLSNSTLLFSGLALVGGTGWAVWVIHGWHKDVPIRSVAGTLSIGVMALVLWWRRVRGDAA